MAAAVSLHCLSTSGLPLFYRTSGSAQPLSFPVIGSLNGIHMYGHTHDLTLCQAQSEDFSIRWKTFHDKISLILIASREVYSDQELSHMLSLVYSALVFMVGVEELQEMKSIDRFKKNAKTAFSLLDHIVNLHSSLFSLADLTNTVDVVCTNTNGIFQSYLAAFLEAAGSPYGYLLVSGRVCVGSPQWWALSPHERILLAALPLSLPDCLSQDIPVFLPHSSPDVPHRLLLFTLLPGVTVGVICGPTPSLAQLEKEVERFWVSSCNSLKQAMSLIPRNLPSHVTVDNHIAGFLLVNSNNATSIFSPTHVEPKTAGQHLTERGPDQEMQLQILREFWVYTNQKLCMGAGVSSEPPSSDSQQRDTNDSFSPGGGNILEAYLVKDNCKLYALATIPPYLLLIIFYPATPTYALKPRAQKLMETLIKEKIL